MTAERQGPFEGSLCLARDGYVWVESYIRRANEDGTYNVEPVSDKPIFLRISYGITLPDLSFNDREYWDKGFGNVICDSTGFSSADFSKALGAMGYKTQSREADEFWEKHCEPLKLDPAAARFDRDSGYELIRKSLFCAKLLVDEDARRDSESHCPPYYNSIRMGGRVPSEIAREVTLTDAFFAWGLEEKAEDPERRSVLSSLEEQQKLRLPTALKSLLSNSDIDKLVCERHPNAPELPYIDSLELLRDLNEPNVDGQYALSLISKNDFEWWAVFNDNEQDARVYLRSERETDEFDDEGEYIVHTTWQFAAPTVGMFFWDLAQTAAIWYRDHEKYCEGKQIQRSDIGLKFV